MSIAKKLLDIQQGLYKPKKTRFKIKNSFKPKSEKKKMALLTLKDFQSAYPILWSKINSIRIETGSNTLDKEFPDKFSIPIRTADASLAEVYLTKSVNSKTPKPLGHSQFEKIKNVVYSEPNPVNWIKVLYASNSREDVDKILNRENKTKKPRNSKNVYSRQGEIVLHIRYENGVYIAYDKDTGEDYTERINHQPKLKFGYTSGGLVRGRKDQNGNYMWRIVREKFVNKEK